MDATVMTRILWWRRQLRRREQWTRDQLHAHQQRELAVLRAFATERSPFYRRFTAAWRPRRWTPCRC